MEHLEVHGFEDLFHLNEGCPSEINSSRHLEVSNRSVPFDRLTLPFSGILAVWASLTEGDKGPEASLLHHTLPPAHRTRLEKVSQTALKHDVLRISVITSGLHPTHFRWRVTEIICGDVWLCIF